MSRPPSPWSAGTGGGNRLCGPRSCRPDGPYIHVGTAGWSAALDDNRGALVEAHALGTDTLVLVVGGLPAGDRDIVAARSRVTDAIAHPAPGAEHAGVRLAIEPMNPIIAADRGVASTTWQSLDVAAEVLHSRGNPGDGFADIPALTRAVTASGYAGPIEVEILREEIWDAPARDVVRIAAERYDQLVAPHL
ncbi:sugar phosphate isomerase/epimerase family protein [Brachybacterium sp. AOP25-B2-12]|uniref:sugar phosphate isomerase/epimerase family protein n=1 Tax=Brachybacterium sp. AOP25-B2-12 TaxID=3457710 RepID=UPI00403478A3